MITITILIGIILILSYLLFREHNKPQSNIATQNVQNVAKYNLITKVFLDVFSQSQQLNTKVEILTGDNESFKKEIQKLEQQVNTLLQEYQTTLELNNKLQIQNTIFTQRNQDLETNQKTFIQKLGGIVYKENLEDKTWDLVLDKVQVLMNERNETVIKLQAVNQDFEVIKKTNEILLKEKDTFNQSLEVLKSIIATKENEINYSLTPKLRGLEFRVQELESKPDHNIELAQIQDELKNLQDVIIQKDGLIQSLEIEKSEYLQKISLLEATITTEKSNCELLTQEKLSLNNRVQQLEGEIQEIQVLNEKLKVELYEVSKNNGNIEGLESQISQKDNEINTLKFENHQNIQKIKQLEISVAEKESQLKTTKQDSDNRTQELEQRIASLTENLRDVEWELSKFNVGDKSGLIEELRKQIAQKNDVIIKWELEDNQNKKELSSIKEDKHILQSLIYQLENEKYNLCQQLDELQKQIAQKDDFIKRLDFDFENNKKENIRLISIVDQLEDDNSKFKKENDDLREELSKARNSTNNNNHHQNIDEDELQKLQRLIAQKNHIIRQLETQLDEFLEYAYTINKYSYILECTEYNFSYSDIEDIDIEYIDTWAEDDFLYFAREFFTFLESYV